MPYSVVLTKEEKGSFVCLVPVTWVEGSFLSWPPDEISDLKVFKLRRNDTIVPEQHWNKLKCVVKVTGIASLAEGIKLEKLYSKFEDTEDEEIYVECNKQHEINNLCDNNYYSINK